MTLESDETRALADHAVRHWGGGTVRRMIANRENTVFEVVLHDGTRAALRLHRVGYQTDAAIRSELAWTEQLSQAGFPCPGPIRTADGALLARPAFGPRASLVGWIDAAPIGPDWAADPDAQCQLYHDLGARIADLHRLSDTIDLPPDFERHHWDIDGLTGPTPLWGPFWNNPALSRSESISLKLACTEARNRLMSRDWDIGLIHADLLQENILGDRGRLSIIDFDDGGFGLRLYDLGTAMVQHAGAPHRADMAAALCDGYGGGHDDLALFTFLRALASAAWVIPRLAASDPRQRTYAERALLLAREIK